MVRARNLRSAATALCLTFSSGVVHADDASDHLRSCATSSAQASCEANRQSFQKDFKLAYRGDYQGQRNVGFCLGDMGGCDGAVEANPPLACAWRVVLLRSGSSKVNDLDIANARTACDKLDPVQKAVADQQAERLTRLIRNSRR